MAENKSSLTKEQIEAASRLLEERPLVLPGTRVILNDRKRVIWYNKVTRTMKELKIIEAVAVKEFCDLAGVPD